MANPNVPQGTLNRLRASAIWVDHPELNVTAAFLGKAGISLTFESEYTVFVDTMTGAVTSPEPYVRCMIMMNLLKTQALANAWKAQAEFNTLLGDCTIRPDAPQLDPYPITNCGIATIRELSFAGLDAGFLVSARGYYIVNQQQWSV